MNRKTFIFITPIIIFFLLELIYFKINFFYILLFLINFLLFFSLKKISNKKIKDKEFLSYLILPFFFVNGLILYILLKESVYLIHLLFVLLIFFVYYYLRQLYLYSQDKTSVKWGNLSFYTSYLALFFVFSFVFGYRSSLSSIGFLTIVLTIATIMLTYYMFWSYDLNKSNNFIIILVIGIIMTELAWVFFFLPFNYNIIALILAILFYMITGITRLYLKESLNKKKIKFYFSVGFGSILLILLTAKFF